MALSYKIDVLTAMISDGLDHMPRGSSTRLAEHAGVTPQTVTKWRKGEVKPEPVRWGLLEEFFGWEEGEIASRVLPPGGGQSTLELVLALTEQVAELTERLALVEARLEPPRSRRGR